jgi:hypothetical protein
LEWHDNDMRTAQQIDEPVMRRDRHDSNIRLLVDGDRERRRDRHLGWQPANGIDECRVIAQSVPAGEDP